jgi:hypothetical protein
MAKRAGAAATVLLALAGCGATADGGAVGAGATAGWDGTKACDRLSQADVQAATGQAAQPGKLEGVVPASGGGAAVSSCTFGLADGGSVGLLTRVSSGQDLAGSVASIKNPPADMAMGTLVDVPGLGRAALWNDTTHQLHWWRDGDHYAILTFSGSNPFRREAMPQARGQAIALARRMGA